MSGCRSHGELVGGYVLGALEPAEMEEMRRHVATCAACGREARNLAGLSALLDTIEPADVPPPQPAPEVEEAVLDRFARERPRPPARRPVVRLRWVAATAAVLAVAGVLASIVSSSDEGGSDVRGYATASLVPTGPGGDARAKAYANSVPAGTRVSLWVRGLEPAAA